MARLSLCVADRWTICRPLCSRLKPRVDDGQPGMSGNVQLFQSGVRRCRIGKNWPTKLHSRDSAFPNFDNNVGKDRFPYCGAIVSGPYPPTTMDGPVRSGSDRYTNDRWRWLESEPAIDYTAGVTCALMAYASMPDSVFQGCTARSPFTGRPSA